jgi:single-strand DNA-binding protein
VASHHRLGRQGTNCAEMLTKGRQVYVEERLRTRWYEKDGDHRRYVTEIVAQRVQFLGPKPNGGVTEPPSEDDIPF